eukprot:9905636-Alexandrium_andersonii.AAC.1
MDYIRTSLKAHPELIVTVKAAIDAKLRGGERLYRGDRTIGSLAQKHTVAAASMLSGHDLSVFKNLPNGVEIARLIVMMAINKGP